MITSNQAFHALDQIIGPDKEVFYLNSQIPLENNQLQHTLYFFTVHKNRLINITPLLTALADLTVTDTQCLRVNGLADWPTQFIKVLDEKGFVASFLTLDQATLVVDITLTFDIKPLPRVLETVEPAPPGQAYAGEDLIGTAIGEEARQNYTDEYTVGINHTFSKPTDAGWPAKNPDESSH